VITITEDDIGRLIHELAELEITAPEKEFGEWLLKEGIDPGVMPGMVMAMAGAMSFAHQHGYVEDAMQAFGSAILSTFMLGWEAHKQFRSHKTI